MKELEQEIFEFLNELDMDSSKITKEVRLIGEDAYIKSRDLVEILLIVEDYLDENYDIEFDWASSNAMSNASSNYRTLDSLLSYVQTIVKNSA
jgi:hypothetical protein